WGSGKQVPLEGALGAATVLLLWFRLDDRPIEGTALWDRSAEIVAPALALALHRLAAHEHLVIRGDNPRPQAVDPPLEALTDFIRQYFDSWSFRAYCGPNPKLGDRQRMVTMKSHSQSKEPVTCLSGSSSRTRSMTRAH